MERLSLAEEERPCGGDQAKAASDEAKQVVAEPVVSAPVEILAAVRQALAKDPQKILTISSLRLCVRRGLSVMQ